LKGRSLQGGVNQQPEKCEADPSAEAVIRLSGESIKHVSR
jgi:hypothetical protein